METELDLTNVQAMPSLVLELPKQQCALSTSSSILAPREIAPKKGILAAVPLPCVPYAINLATTIFQTSNADNGAFVLIRVSVLPRSCRSPSQTLAFLANAQRI